MPWSVDEQEQVFTELIGTWPDTLGEWGKEAISAYVAGLEKRGIDAGLVMGAILSYPAGASNFPPSGANLAAAALADHSKPTFTEAYRLIYGPGGVLRARPEESSFTDLGERGRAYDQAGRDRAAELHPMLCTFVGRYTVDALRMLEVDHPELGPLRRRDLEAAWDRHCHAMEGRSREQLVQLAAGKRGDQLRALDPMTAVHRPRGVLEPASTEEIS